MPITWHEIGPAPITDSLTNDAVTRQIVDNADLQSFTRATDADDLLVVVNDPMRATPTHVALRALDNVIETRNDAAANYTLLIATGTHHFDTHARTAFERELTNNLSHPPARILWHDANAPDLVPIGAAHYHPALAAHAHILAVGSVEPHYFAGLTGPHKTLTIGCMDRAGIERNHAGAMDARAQPVQLDDNPVAEGVAARVRELHDAGKHLLAVGLVAQADTIADIAIGPPLDVVARLRTSAERVFVGNIAAPADVVHLRVEGPLARTLYQADKATKNNAAAVRNGGTMILEADCVDGLGPDAFMNLLRSAKTYRDVLAAVSERGYSLGDHKAVRLRHLMDPSEGNVRLLLVAKHLPPESLEGSGIATYPDVDAAVAQACRTQSPPPSTGLRIRDAANVITLTVREG